MGISLEPVQFESTHSMKDIPIPGIKEYITKLTSKGSDYINRTRWRSIFALNGDADPDISHPDILDIMENKENYGFRSGNAAPFVPILQEFEKKFWDIIKNVKFHNRPNEFQNMMKRDLNQLKQMDKIVVFADKSNNLYCVSKNEYLNEIKNNITTEYKRSTTMKVDEVNKKAAIIAKRIGQEKNMEVYTPSDCFITIKDHKSDFPSKVNVRVIAPSKSDVGRVSKHLLQRIVQELNVKLKFNQWRDPQEVTKWFKEIRCKRSASFLKFDIVGFYPAITKSLFERALNFASKHVHISKVDLDTIFAARQSFLFHEGEPWEKVGAENFDVTMGAYDGAECCEVVGLYLLHKLTEKGSGTFSKAAVGLYRDDGLSIVRGGPVEVERVSKKLRKIFEKEGLKITLESGKDGTDYLNLYLDLKKDTFRQWRKPNSSPLYVNINSSHPPQCLKQIPTMIENMISKNSSSKEEFNRVKKDYQASLKNSGYKKKLKYNPNANKKKRRHRRNRIVTYFNPPWGNNVKTNIAGKFLKLIDEYEEKFKGTPLGRIFTRATMKVAYSTTRNMKAHIAAHNRKILSKMEEPMEGCNCRENGDLCPLEGQCLQGPMVYKATVTTNESNPITKVYHGMTGGTFKKRYGGHKYDFKHKDKYGTTLSRYIWRLRDMNVKFSIKWQIKEKAPIYKPGSKECKLCNAEKYHILMEDYKKSLNVRSELLSKCRHKLKWKLVKLL